MLTPAARGEAERPWIVHGSDCSYYTGKLECYLRAKGIPYLLRPFTESGMKRCAAQTGVLQIPQVECADGTWLVDTTLILEYAERERPEPCLHAGSAPLAFLAMLLEDFADEWLWRPAMHYRWSFRRNALLMADWLAEHIVDTPGPAFLKRLYWRQRQLRTFVTGDGVTRRTRAAVEATYLATLGALEGVVSVRPYLLGDRPTAADFGFFGPMFRHFSCDPVPGRIMRSRAPAVNEWVARMWNTRPERLASAAVPAAVPPGLEGLLALVTREYLPYLGANAEAFAQGRRRVRYEVAGVTFEEPVKPYRVWCLDRLVRHFLDLAPADRAEVEARLASPVAVRRLSTPSARPCADPVGSLPLVPGAPRRPLDSWWRGS